MFFRGKKKEPDHHAPPPGDKGWDSFALAMASGAGIIAVTVLEIEFFSALILGEFAGAALVSAQERHERKAQKLHDWHMSLVGHNIDRVLDRLIEKPVASLTDKDRIQLALLSDWGLIAEDRAECMSPALKAEVLMTQLTISAQQQGISILKLAEKFSFPRLSLEDRGNEAAIQALEADRARLKEMLLQKNATPSWGAGMRDRLGKSFAGRAIHIVAKDIKAVRSAAGLVFELPSLKKIWNILSARGPANSAEEFMDRMAKDLRSAYESGLVRQRCAIRRSLKQAGIPHEGVLVQKPEGGKRYVVRPKRKFN